MVTFLRELRNYSVDDLLTLLDIYTVRDHQGKEYEGKRSKDEEDRDSILEFINQWLEPDVGFIHETNLLEAVKTGQKFDYNTAIQENLFDQIFGQNSKFEISTEALGDFYNYPIRNAFGYDPWKLLQGYILSPNKDDFFLRFSSKSPEKFLNFTEKLFYLTRGYGRPISTISKLEAFYRKFILQADPTALIVLMDIMGICPEKQWPQKIKEGLSAIDLRGIDPLHRNAMFRVSECLKGKICNSNGRCPDKVQCFKSFLRNLGILDLVEYDPQRNILRSNLCQLSRYKSVIPEKKWNWNEIKNLPDSFISGYLSQLPDYEILKIEAQGFKFKDKLDFSSIDNLFRSKLVDQANRFLLDKQFIIQKFEKNVYYGRFADEYPKSISIKKLIRDFSKFQSLMDRDGQVYTVEEIRNLGNTTNQKELLKLAAQVQAQVIQYQRKFDQLTKDQKDRLWEILRNFDLGNFDRDEFQTKSLKRISDITSKLILWKNIRGKWIPLTINWTNYFEKYVNKYPELFKDTLRYTFQII